MSDNTTKQNTALSRHTRDP